MCIRRHAPKDRHFPENPLSRWFRYQLRLCSSECRLFFTNGNQQKATNGNRTHDLILTKDVLYRLSYSSILFLPPDHEHHKKKKRAGEGNRTLVSSLEGYGSTIELRPLLSGGTGIRTPESIASRFTVCPLWPLGNTTICQLPDVKLEVGLEPTTC